MNRFSGEKSFNKIADILLQVEITRGGITENTKKTSTISSWDCESRFKTELLL